MASQYLRWSGIAVKPVEIMILVRSILQINSLAAQPSTLLRHVSCRFQATCFARHGWNPGRMAFHGPIMGAIKRSLYFKHGAIIPSPLLHFHHVNFDSHVPQFHGKPQMSFYLEHRAWGALEEELSVKRSFIFILYSYDYKHFFS